MKYVLVFLLVCVALASAAPQFFTFPYGGYTPYTASRTLVAGPTVVNGFGGARYTYPGYYGTF